MQAFHICLSIGCGTGDGQFRIYSLKKLHQSALQIRDIGLQRFRNGVKR